MSAIGAKLDTLPLADLSWPLLSALSAVMVLVLLMAEMSMFEEKPLVWPFADSRFVVLSVFSIVFIETPSIF